ncbi:MAG TPA: DUF3842 family protein [Clostridia bacterium]|nr:DUF3842 family protein [Clostridia bacterium]
MKVLVIDGQGGGLGKQLVVAIKAVCSEAEITAIGTNSMATNVMLKAGADNGATGENAIVVGCRDADIIVGPIGMVIADALLGEITPRMAVAIGQSRAKRIMIPMNHCNNLIAGIPEQPVGRLVQSAVQHLKDAIN